MYRVYVNDTHYKHEKKNTPREKIYWKNSVEPNNQEENELCEVMMVMKHYTCH